MNNLVSEQRPDKNGKIVTRHVKADVNGATVPVSLPAPQAPMTSQTTDTGLDKIALASLRYDLTEAVLDLTVGNADTGGWEDGEGENSDRENVYGALMYCPETLLLALDDTLETDHKQFQELAAMIRQGEKWQFMSNYIAFSEMGHYSGDQRVALVRSLEHYPQLTEYGDLRTASQEAQSKVRALLKTADVLSSMVHDDYVDIDTKDFEFVDHDYDFSPAPVIRNKELIEFIMQHHDRVDNITAIIRERSVLDPQVIATILEHPEQALSNGVL